ncbi:MAG: flagellar basal body protein [Actinomycetes bacterium]|jgi:flagellar basal-body rod protein FlgB|nr:MAG: flagellar biosynthesis protein FlgB [Actinomycetota bacterium]
MNDVTMRAIEYALGGLNLRSEVIANNVANAEVPGFTASHVSFERQLASALDRGSFDDTPAPTVMRKGDVFNGINEVSLEDEMVEMIRTGLLRDAMVSAYNFKADQLRTAMKGVMA